MADKILKKLHGHIQGKNLTPMDKIDKHFDIKLIHTVRGVGYVLKEAS